MTNQQNKEKSENKIAEILYKSNKKEKVQIFGYTFVKNNKDKCKIRYNDKEYELKTYFNDIDKKYNNENIIKIKLKGINKITNMSYMFNGCIALSSSTDISNWDTSNVTDMSYMFNNCNTLYTLFNISNLDISNVIDMSYMFNGCNSLTSLPDISKWDISKVTDMSYMFNGCIVLISLPDILYFTGNKATLICIFL